MFQALLHTGRELQVELEVCSVPNQQYDSCKMHLVTGYNPMLTLKHFVNCVIEQGRRSMIASVARENRELNEAKQQAIIGTK